MVRRIVPTVSRPSYGLNTAGLRNTTSSARRATAASRSARSTAVRNGWGAILRSLRAEELRERPAAHDRLRPLRDDVRAGASLVVAALDQQPLRLGARSRALKREAAAE